MLEMTTGLYTYYGRKNSIDRRKLKSRRKKHEQDQKRRISSIWRQEATPRNQDHLPQRLGVNSLPFTATSNSKALFVDSCGAQEQQQQPEDEGNDELYRDEPLANGTFDWSGECPNKSPGKSKFPDADKQKYHTTATPFLNPNG